MKIAKLLERDFNLSGVFKNTFFTNEEIQNKTHMVESRRNESSYGKLSKRFIFIFTNFLMFEI